MTLTAFAMVRMDTHDGLEYIDISTVSTSPIGAGMKAGKWDEEIPQWAKDNPVQRCIKVEIKEVPSC